MRSNHLHKTLSSLLLSGIALLPCHAEVTDPALRHGTLPNGLTYYIYQNANPENRADFFLARNIGSRVEAKDEKGLAHFLEHMCFNGSRNFPDNQMIEWLESVGVKFGKNLNAYTSADETVYNISMVPTVRESVLDSCLMVLRDWSDGLTLSEEAIEAERGVIEGEWRHRDNASSRMLRRAAPRIYPGSPYGEAMPIGDMEVVMNFPPEKLRTFYRTWYTPEAEAVIVTGDIDPDKIEEKIKTLFSDMQPDKESKKVTDPIIAENERLSVIVESDPEQGANMLQLYFKHTDDKDLTDDESLRRELICNLVTEMLVERFDALELADNTPVANVGLGSTTLPLSKKALAYVVRTQTKPGRTPEALSALWREIRRARELGFSDEEFLSARNTVLDKERSEAKEKQSRNNTDIAKSISRYYLGGGTFETPTQRLERVEKLMEGLTSSDCKKWMEHTMNPSGRNVVALAYLRPGKEGSLPTEQEMTEAFMNVNIETPAPYTVLKNTNHLLESEPQRGEVVSSEPSGYFDATLLTLSNGVKVMLKPTDFKKDQIYIRGVGEGGFSQHYTEEAAPSLKIFNEAMALSGAGSHSNGDLRRMLAGRDIKVSVMADRNDETVEVSTTPTEIEDAMRLLWLKATSLKPDSAAFNTWYVSRMDQLDTDVTTPVNRMGELIHKAVYNDHPLGHKLTAQMLSQADYGRIMQEYADRFSDFSDFTFYITGDFNIDTMTDLLERYVASLPAGGRVEKKKDIGYCFTPGSRKLDFTEEMMTPVGIVYQFRHLECPYNLRNIILASMAGQVLKSRLLSDLREEKGWTYSITTHGSMIAGMNGDNPSEFMMPVYVKVSPENVGATGDIIKNTLWDMSVNVTDEEFDKVKQYMLKSHAENSTDNAYWLAAMRALTRFGLDLDTEYDSILNELTSKDLSAFVTQYALPAQLTEMTMCPK